MKDKKLVQIRVGKDDHEKSRKAAELARVPLATLARVALQEKTDAILRGGRLVG